MKKRITSLLLLFVFFAATSYGDLMSEQEAYNAFRFGEDKGETIALIGNSAVDVYSNEQGVDTASSVNVTYVNNANATINESFEDAYTTDYGIGGETGTFEQQAQSFSTSKNVYSPKISVNIKKVGTPTDDIILEIQTDSSGKPSGTLVHENASVALDSSEISASFSYVDFDFPWNVRLNATTTYHIVMRRTASRDSSNIIRWSVKSGNAYSGGSQNERNSGTWSTDTNIDFNFKVYEAAGNYYVSERNAGDTVEESFLNTYATGFSVDGGPGNAEEQGQEFELSSAIDCSKLSVQIKKEGLPTDNIIVEIQTDSSGKPSGTPVTGTTVTKAATLISTSYSYVDFEFASPVSLSASTKYHIVMRRSGSKDGFKIIRWSAVNTDSYADGDKTEKRQGSWVTESGYDHNFKVWEAGSTEVQLISEGFTAKSVPDDAKIIIFEEDIHNITLNTDIKAYIRRGGEWSSALTLSDFGDYDDGRRILSATADLSTLTSGTELEYKIEVFNNDDLKIHGVGLSWE